MESILIPDLNRKNYNLDNTTMSRLNKYNIKNKKIISILLINDDRGIVIELQDGYIITISNNYQCCEERYFNTDDRISDYLSTNIIDIKIKTWKDFNFVEDKNGYDANEEIQFIDIVTNKGTIQFKNYNIHNGYYEGFDGYLSLYKKKLNKDNYLKNVKKLFKKLRKEKVYQCYYQCNEKEISYKNNKYIMNIKKNGKTEQVELNTMYSHNEILCGIWYEL